MLDPLSARGEERGNRKSSQELEQYTLLGCLWTVMASACSHRCRSFHDRRFVNKRFVQKERGPARDLPPEARLGHSPLVGDGRIVEVRVQHDDAKTDIYLSGRDLSLVPHAMTQVERARVICSEMRSFARGIVASHRT